jgi:hypothetical protein
VLKPNGISTTLYKLPKGVRHIPIQFKNATTQVIKSLYIVFPQFLIIPRYLKVRPWTARPVLPARTLRPRQHDRKFSTLLGQSRP